MLHAKQSGGTAVVVKPLPGRRVRLDSNELAVSPIRSIHRDST